jgi:hypothetical protein
LSADTIDDATTRGATFGGGTIWNHSISSGPVNTFTTLTPPGRSSARRECDSDRQAACDAEYAPNTGQFASTLKRPQRILTAERLPRLGDADEYDRCAGRLQRGRRFLTDDAPPVRYQNAPEFRIGGHLTPLPVVRHVGGLPFGMREGYRLPAFVQLKRHHDRLALFAVGVQVRHERRPAFHRDQPDAPWRTLAEMHVGRNVQRGFGQQRAAPRRIREDEIGGKARRTRIARRIAERCACSATLQHEAALGGGPCKTVRGPAARARRRRRQPRP